MGTIHSFSQNQLKVLLKGLGYSKVAGININPDTLDNEIVLTTLNELTKAGIVLADEDKFTVADTVRDIICYLGDSSEYIAVHSSNSDIPDKCLFAAEKLLVCSVRHNDFAHIQTEIIDYNELFDALDDEGYFACDHSDVEIDERALEEFEKTIFEGVNPNMPFGESSAVMFSMENITSEGCLLKFMRIVEYYFYTYIVHFDGNTVVRELYSRDNAKKYCEKMIIV